MKLDLGRLQADVHRLEARIRTLKNELRTAHPPDRELWLSLFAAKAEATLLYAIRAHSRGRLHLSKVIRRHAPLGLPPMPAFTLEDQARLIGDRWKAYAPFGEAA